jgi:hypothetical protein
MYCIYGRCAVRVVLTYDVFLCDLQVLDIEDLGSAARSEQAKQGKAKPSQQRGKPAEASQAMWRRQLQSSPVWDRCQIDLVCSSVIDVLATHVCTNLCSLTRKE